MRGAVPGLGSPYTLAQMLPAIFQEDDFTTQLTTAWDEVLAPVISTLDCLDAYLDPRLAPPDHLRWLADRLGARLDTGWPLDRQRAAAAEAVRGHRRRGTLKGLRAHIERATGGQVDVTDSGGVFTSAAPGAPLVADWPGVAIRVTVPNETMVETEDLRLLAAECVPAHVALDVEVVSR